MSSHRHIGRIIPSGVPPAPPPPVLSSRSGSGRSSRRSRSRSPPSRNSESSRYPQSQSQSHHRDSREGERQRDRSRRRSRSPYQSDVQVVQSGSDAFRINPARINPVALPHGQSHTVIHKQSISLIPGEASLPIIRRILNPDEVKIPRRPAEGSRPIFDRDDLKEAMLRRMRSDNNDENPAAAPPVLPQTQQRVIAIIREPPSMMEAYRMSSMKKEPSAPSSYLSSSRHPQHQSSHQSPPRNSFRSSGATSSSFQRSLSTRDRSGSGRRSSLERSPDRKQDLLNELKEIRQRAHQDLEADPRPRSRDRSERERVDRPHNPGSVPPHRRSRSPVRILRERMSRSRSVTPPPMPPEMRRQIIERERDLRSKLSRPIGKMPSKFDSEHDVRPSSSYRGSSRGFPRGRGFIRGGRSREDGRPRRGFWEHDMFERDRLEQPAGDLKSHKD